MDRQLQVALAVRAGVPYLQDMIEVILAYGRERNWQTLMGLEYWPTFSAKQLRGWHGDGVIAWLNTRDEADVICELAIPTVNVSASLKESPVPRVALDDFAVGALAAEHLLDRGFRRFAHYATRNRWYARRREAGFVERLRAAGADCVVLRAAEERADYDAFQAHEHELIDWLTSLNTPVGVFATHDYRARHLLEISQRIGLRVPDDVSVLGVNNDLTVCNQTHPTLTSVSRSGQAVGTQAARLLDRMMSGGWPTDKTAEIRIPPDMVVPRGSTDVRPLEDPLLAAAVRFMKENLYQPINIDDVTRALDVSRRSLERAFRAELATTPYVYLCQARVERARKILSEDRKKSMDEVARECGISNGRILRRVFHRFTNSSPRHARHRKT